MRLSLKLHPDSICAAVVGIDVEVARASAGSLVLSYIVTGTIGDLRLPALAAPVRTDELWKHTCFEVFVCATAADSYYEFNFAPSTQWAAYRFDGYRSGMTVASEIGAPRIDVQSNAERYELQVALALDPLPGAAKWRLGLSAMIEETNGRKSYWALAHPPSKPDFHHADCFTLELAAPSRP